MTFTDIVQFLFLIALLIAVGVLAANAMRRSDEGKAGPFRGAIDIVGFGHEDEESGDPGEGGPSIFMEDLEHLRESGLREAQKLGSKELTPEAWEAGRLAFEFERALAHDHDGIRDRLSSHVAAAVRDSTADLYDAASEVGQTRDELRRADRNLVTVTRAWKKILNDVQHDELEIGRYTRLRSRSYKFFKILVGACFFGAEVAISTALFDGVVEADNPALPILFALGLILMLIFVPHYSAIGLKEGLTKNHEYEQAVYENAGVEVPHRVRKKVQQEQVEDLGFKLIAGVLGLVLIGLFIPLSSLRATELAGPDAGWDWFVFFLLMQFAISGYFFLREWMDHGIASHNLKHLDELMEGAEDDRLAALENYAGALADFHAQAEDLHFYLKEAPRWDSHIVQSYLATIHQFRHAVALQRDDLDAFITNAREPTLSLEKSIGEINRPLDPVSREHPSLERDDSFGREWWLEQAAAALKELPRPDISDDGGEGSVDGSWLITSGPTLLLREYLRRFFGVSELYQHPPEIDDPPTFAEFEGLPASDQRAPAGIEVPAEFGDNGAPKIPDPTKIQP